MSSTTGFYIDSEALLLAANGLQKSGVELLKTVNNLDFVAEPGNLVSEVYRAAARGKKITTGLAELTSNQGKLLNNSTAAYVAQDKFNDVSSVISFNDITPGKSGKQRGNVVAENFDNFSQGITAVKVLNTNLDSLQQLATGMNEHVNHLDMHHKIVRQQVEIATDTWRGDAADNFLHKMGQHLAKVSKHIVNTENFSKLVENQVASLKVYRDNIKNTISAMVETDPSRVEYDYNNDTYIYNHAGQSDFIVAKNNKILTDLQNSLAANLGSFGSVVKDLNEEARKKYFPLVKAENENKNLCSSVNKTAETKPGAHTKVRVPKSKANSVGAVSGNKGQVKGIKVDSKGRRLRVIPPRIYPNGAKNVTANFNYNNNFSHIPRAINPPTYPPTDNLDRRNYNWLRYLRGYDYNGKRRSYRSKPAAYPDPSQVTDPRLKMIGAMGQQQGTQYAWGGGHGGSKPGPSLGQIDSNGGYDDRNVMGMDCAGLVRYGYYEATRVDCMPDWNTNRIYAYFNNPAKGEIVGNLNDSHTLSKIRPGDIILIGQYPNTTHVEVYAGNGTIVQTNQSQTSANFSELAHGTQEATVFRPKAFKG